MADQTEQTTLVPNEEEAFALEPIDITGENLLATLLLTEGPTHRRASKKHLNIYRNTKSRNTPGYWNGPSSHHLVQS